MKPFHWIRALAVVFLTSRAVAEESCYLFSYFTGNGEDGLHLAWSKDGLQWDALKGGASVLTPKVGGMLMRDPCVLRGPDGTFHMVWTDAWKGITIGYACSRDLINWSEQKSLPVMKDEPTTKNSWAPELAYDSKTGRFTIFWASSIPGKFPETDFDGKNDSNHRIYATTTKDFAEFSPTKLFFNPGFNCIDSTILPHEGRFVMFFKDETKSPNPMKNLRIATADTISGNWMVREKPVTDPNSWVEGPSALKVGNEVFLYFDVYTKHHYAALKSSDLETWTDVTAQLRMPKGIRHGTAFAVSRDILEPLLKP